MKARKVDMSSPNFMVLHGLKAPEIQQKVTAFFTRHLAMDHLKATLGIQGIKLNPGFFRLIAHFDNNDPVITELVSQMLDWIKPGETNIKINVPEESTIKTFLSAELRKNRKLTIVVGSKEVAVVNQALEQMLKLPDIFSKFNPQHYEIWIRMAAKVGDQQTKDLLLDHLEKTTNIFGYYKYIIPVLNKKYSLSLPEIKQKIMRFDPFPSIKLTLKLDEAAAAFKGTLATYRRDYYEGRQLLKSWEHDDGHPIEGIYDGYKVEDAKELCFRYMEKAFASEELFLYTVRALKEQGVSPAKIKQKIRGFDLAASIRLTFVLDRLALSFPVRLVSNGPFESWETKAGFPDREVYEGYKLR